MTITLLPKRIHALSIAAALGASAFVLPGASATEAEVINVNDCLASLINSEFASNCPYENLEFEIDTVEVLVQSIENGQATVRLAPLYEGAYVGDASRVYLGVQYYTPSGLMTASDTFEPADIKTERAADGSMLLTFTMPQMPAEGYYSISAMDLETSDMGYGEFMISEGSLVPYTIPIEDDSDEVMVDKDDVVVDKKKSAHHVPTIDELKALEKAREEEQKNQQAADQKGSKDKVKTEVPSDSSEHPNLETHTQKLEQVPGGSTSSRDTQTLNASELKVAYAEVRSDKETKPVTISAERLPANAAGYDLIVVETDMSGNHKGDALSITHISSNRIVNGAFKEEIGMPGSLLKTGSVYTAYLVRADDTEYAEEVVSVRFKVSGEATGSSASSRKDGLPRQDANAPLTPSATQGSPFAATSTVSTRSDATQSGSGQSATSAPRSTLDAVSAMSKAKEAKAERQRQALQALAQARTMSPRSAFEPTHTNQISAYSSGSDPASIAVAANSGTVVQGSTSDATSGNGNKGFTPVIHSETNTRSTAVNSTPTQVQANTNTARQDGVKAAESAADPTSEEAAQHGTVFWAIGGVGLTLVAGAAWMAHRRGFLSS